MSISSWESRRDQRVDGGAEFDRGREEYGHSDEDKLRGRD
jgi:hypothetical protein